MSYVATAYGMVVVALALYSLYLVRERSRLRRTLGQGAAPDTSNPQQ